MAQIEPFRIKEGSERVELSGAAMDRPAPTRDGWRRHLKAGIAGVALLVLAGIGYTLISSASYAIVDAKSISVADVRTSMFSDFVLIRAAAQPSKTVMLDVIEPGRVETVEVRDGDSVTQGAVLARLSNAERLLDLLARETEVAQQRTNLENLRLAFSQNASLRRLELDSARIDVTGATRNAELARRAVQQAWGTQVALDKAEDALALAQVRLATAEKSQTEESRIQGTAMEQIGKTVQQLESNLKIAQRATDALTLRAPISGKLVGFDIQPGQSLERGTKLGSIEDPSGFVLRGAIDEAYVSRVTAGARGVATIADEDVKVEVSRVFSEVRSGLVTLELAFIGAMPSNLRTGRSVDVRLDFGAPEQRLVAPNGEWVTKGGGGKAWVLDEQGKNVRAVPIELGRRNPREVEVLKGLKSGDRIVVSGSSTVFDADKARIEGVVVNH